MEDEKPLTIHERRYLNWLEKQLKEQRGMGQDENYRAWLYLRRKRSSRISQQVLGNLPLSYRRFNFLSKLESQFALVLLWCGARNIREQLPIWPVAHPSPFGGAPLRSIEDVVELTGRKLERHVGTRFPHIYTADMLAVVPTAQEKLVDTLISIKPDEAAIKASNSIEVEALYAQECGAVHLVLTKRHLDNSLFDALLSLTINKSTISRVTSDSIRFEKFCDAFDCVQDELPLEHARTVAASSVANTDPSWTESAFRAAVWLRRIDVDPVGIVRSRPARRGLHARLKASLDIIWGGKNDGL